ncbi:MAG: parallel beta-helix domain-containing protein [Cyclobacteriaceae bacterium]
MERQNIQWKSIEKDLQTRFITVEDGAIIELPEGYYMFTRPLLIDGKKSVTIRGQGIDKTILSFQLQSEGAEGIKASNCKNLEFEDFTIEDAIGDNIKVTDTEGITFRRVKSQWTGGPKEENGAYAFYPVLCKQVLVEESIAIGSSDAGIYVGQSDSVIIRNNTVNHNVAGIESENSRWVEIYGNETYRNTGGILVFDMPGLTQSGHTTRVFNNIVRNNNLWNFAPPGNIVGTVPAGTGMMLLATRNIEIFDNIISNNMTLGIGIASYDLVEALGAEAGSQLDENIETAKTDLKYDPYPNQVNIHDNEFENSYWFPTMKNDFGWLFMMKFPFNTPDIVYDGIPPGDDLFEMCLTNNGSAKFANLDAANNFDGLSTDVELYACSQPIIAPIF